MSQVKAVRIARKLNRELCIRGDGITEKQVTCVMNGERCESHPVISAIVHEVTDPHERIRIIAKQRAEDAPCFGGV
jgi:hypothetical protein